MRGRHEVVLQIDHIQTVLEVWNVLEIDTEKIQGGHEKLYFFQFTATLPLQVGAQLIPARSECTLPLIGWTLSVQPKAVLCWRGRGRKNFLKHPLTAS